jgi:hypothetical protein
LIFSHKLIWASFTNSIFYKFYCIAHQLIPLYPLYAGQSKMDNPETLATLGTQDTWRRQQDKNTTQYVLNTTMHKQRR